MQPVELELHYFGPYKNEKINFRELTSTPVFLVSGNTGSGKTTIFDAMCYALFGQTTNDQDRDAAALRSDFAPHDQETSVTFTFTHRGKTYQITRKPKQQLLGRGKKLVDHNTKVSLIYPLEEENPTEINKVGPANDFIEKLLNLNRDQFKQIVLLPQGKFRQFLESSSSDKESLLRDLFGTSLYEQWAQALKDRLADQRKGHQDTVTQLATVKGGLDSVNSELPTTEWLMAVQQQISEQTTQGKKISREIIAQDQVVKKLNHQLAAEQTLADALAERQQTQGDLQKLQRQKSDMEKIQKTVTRLNWYQKHQKDYLDYQHAQADLDKQQERLTSGQATDQKLRERQVVLATTAQQLTGRQAQIQQLQEQSNVLKNQLPQYARMAELTKVVHDQQQLVTDHEQAVHDQQVAVQKLHQQLQTVTNQLAELTDLDQQELQLEERHHQLREANARLTNYQEHLKQQTSLKEQIDHHQATVAKQQSAIDEAKAEYEDLKDAHARSEIARLASDLKPGTPCPVCGSTEHPHPADGRNHQPVVSQKQVEVANGKLTRLKQDQAATNSQLAAWHEQVAQETTTLQKILADLNQIMKANFADHTEAQDFLMKEKTTFVAAQKKLDEQKRQRDEWRTAQADYTKQQETGQAQLTKLQDKLSEAKLRLAQNQATYQSLVDGLEGEYADEEAVKKQLSDWQKQIDDFTEAQTQNQKMMTDVTERLGANQHLLMDVQRMIKQDQEQAERLKDQLTQALTNFSADLDWQFWEWATANVADLENLQGRLEKYQSEQTRLYSLLERLNRQIDERSTPDLQQTRAKLNRAQEQLATLQQQSGELQSELKTTQDVYQRVQKLDQQQSAGLKKIQDLQTVSDVMNGNTDNKLSLERYVLQNYLAEVLRVANERLAKLTNGRYAFQLSDEQAKGNGTKWSGLEINVYDDNAGQERSARTLSGGESFIASLALALGLGEVIQERSGGIQVDALFIDEGFGSLDQDALNQALNALQTIHGYQMIGIISHVTELENQVPNQLQVISQNGVSHVRYRHEIANL